MSPSIRADSLPGSGRARQFVGADHDGVPVSFFVIRYQPGDGVELHRHPYAEIFVLTQGEARFRLGDAEIEAVGGEIVTVPPNTAHGFAHSGQGELLLTAIHTAPEMATEWLSDEEWWR
jgi:quercetin dioxygenase-like cupin family protein